MADNEYIRPRGSSADAITELGEDLEEKLNVCNTGGFENGGCVEGPVKGLTELPLKVGGCADLLSGIRGLRSRQGMVAKVGREMGSSSSLSAVVRSRVVSLIEPGVVGP